jgi:dipeptidyl aminopeptidase/acylaminoacyl peptidase
VLAGLHLLGCLAAAIPLPLFFSNPEFASPKLSPDGAQISWLAADSNGVRNVWVRNRAGGEKRQVTHDASRGITQYLWHPGVPSILYFQDRDGDENFHLFEAPLDGAAPRDLTPLPGVRAELLASANSELLLLMNRRERRYFEVHRLNLKTGALRLDTENPGDIVQWAAGPDLVILGAVAYKADGSQHVLVRASPQDAWRTASVIPAGQNLARLMSGKQIYLLTSRLERIDPATATLAPIAQDSQADIADVIVNPQTGAVDALAFERSRKEWRFFDNRLKRDFAKLQRASKLTEVTLISADSTGRYRLYGLSTAESPARYFLHDRKTGQLEHLFDSRPELSKHRLAPMQSIELRARDGLTLHGYLTMPNGPTKNPPAVILVHGGPWTRDSYGYSGVVQFLANRGYAVLQVNYRGSTGYGSRFLHAGDREWGGKMLTDILDAKHWAERRGYIDSKRCAIMGASFGGYLTLSALAFAPTEFRAGIDMMGQSNLLTFLGSIPKVAGPVLSLYDERVGNLERDTAMLRSRSPLFSADRITAPLLIAQGANDPRVPAAESEQMVDALRALGRPVQYMLFPDEGHGLVRPANIIRFMTEVEQFLDKHLRAQ